MTGMVGGNPDPGGWPLSAPATALLRDPGTPPHELLRLALRELVVRRAVRVRLVERSRGRPPVAHLALGDAAAESLPPPLPLLAEALRPHLTDEGTRAHTVVQQASGWRADLATRVRDASRHELRAAGLLVSERDRVLGVVPRTRWRRTPSGQAWARSADGAAVAAAGVLPAVGLLLALDEELQRRLRDAAGSDGGGPAGDDADTTPLDDVLGAAGPALDSAADAGSGGAGDGGDGGGGGD